MKKALIFTVCAMALLAAPLPIDARKKILVSMIKHPARPVRTCAKLFHAGVRGLCAPIEFIAQFLRQPKNNNLTLPPDDLVRLAYEAQDLAGIAYENRALLHVDTLEEGILGLYDDGLIIIDAQRLAQRPYGVQRLTLLHEAFHHKFGDSCGIGELCEHRADKHTLKTAQCWQCVYEFAECRRDTSCAEYGYATYEECISYADGYKTEGCLCAHHSDAAQQAPQDISS